MRTQLEIYLLQTISDMMDIARGIDNREAMLEILEKIADRVLEAVEEVEQ